MIDVLMRRGDQVIPGRRYRSHATLFGQPILAISTGPAPGEKKGHARGIIAIGDRATGLLARAVQHEIDHLNGVLLVDRMSPVQKVAVAGKLKRLRKQAASRVS